MPQLPLPRVKKGGDGDFWTKLNRRRQFTDESAEVWETRGSSSRADAVYEGHDGSALRTPTKVSDRIARLSSVQHGIQPELNISPVQSHLLTGEMPMRISRAALTELKGSDSPGRELLNFQRSMSFPRGNHTHTEGCSTAASTSSSVSSHTNRICNLRNSNGAIESFDGKSTSEMLEETRDSDIADSPSPAPAIPEGKGGGIPPLQIPLSLPLESLDTDSATPSQSVTTSVTRFRMNSNVSADSDESPADAYYRSQPLSPNPSRLTPSSSSNTEEGSFGQDNAALQCEIVRLQLELEESRRKIRDLEERQEGFWDEGVFDIVNRLAIQRPAPVKDEDSNMHSVSIKSLLPSDFDPSIRDARRGTRASSCSSICSFHTAISSFNWSDDDSNIDAPRFL